MTDSLADQLKATTLQYVYLDLPAAWIWTDKAGMAPARMTGSEASRFPQRTRGNRQRWVLTPHIVDRRSLLTVLLSAGCDQH